MRTHTTFVNDIQVQVGNDLALRAQRVVVTGLLGLDAEHVGHSELHPIYALAVQIRCATQEAAGSFSERWAVVLRNWGNEGYCSSYRCLHHLVLDANGTFTMRLPLGNVADVQDLRLGEGVGETDLGASSAEVRVAAAVDLDPSGSAALVRFRLPSPTDRPLLYGELTLRFKARRAAGCPPRPAVATPSGPVTPASTSRAAGRGQEQAGEEGAEGLLRDLGESAPPEITRAASVVLDRGTCRPARIRRDGARCRMCGRPASDTGARSTGSAPRGASPRVRSSTLNGAGTARGR